MSKAENIVGVIAMTFIIAVVVYCILNPENTPQNEAQACVDHGGTPVAVYSHALRRTNVICIYEKKE